MDDKIKSIELKSLIGKHRLSGVDFENEKIKRYEWDDLTDCQVVRFCLDGITYMAVEDPSDGYRSAMQHCLIIEDKPKNIFADVEVYGIMKDKGYYNENDIVQFYDTVSNEIILEVGTSNSDDYYPSWVANWTPENMYVNK